MEIIFFMGGLLKRLDAGACFSRFLDRTLRSIPSVAVFRFYIISSENIKRHETQAFSLKTAGSSVNVHDRRTLGHDIQMLIGHFSKKRIR
jgi:hypothetical protein